MKEDTCNQPLSTKVTKQELLEDAVVDEYGVKYSKDGKRLLRGEIKGRYTVRDGTEVICNWALSGCGKTRVNIPSSVTNIGENAFRKCGYINVDKNNTKYTSVDGVLYSKNKRVLVQYPNRKGAFAIPSFVKTIGKNAFEWCSGLTSVTIPDSVTSIGCSAFEHCSGLTSVTIPNSITSINAKAFWVCEGLTSVTIPDSVTEIGEEAFEFCSGLTSVDIPNSVKKIGRGAFWGCI